MSFFRYIHGKYIRIFCNFCKLALKKCECQDCYNYDLKSRFCVHYEVKNGLGRRFGDRVHCGYICYNHPKCDKCHVCLSVDKCGGCDINCCAGCLYDDVNILCNTCSIQREIAELRQIIQIFYDVDTAKIIAEYAVGYVVICCNENVSTSRPCGQEIVIQSRSYLNNYQDINGNRIYHYERQSISTSINLISIKRSTRLLYGKEYRIFCHNCLRYNITECVFNGCNIKECGSNQCGAHGNCKVCNHEWLPLTKCIHCKELLCDNHKYKIN